MADICGTNWGRNENSGPDPVCLKCNFFRSKSDSCLEQLEYQPGTNAKSFIPHTVVYKIFQHGSTKFHPNTDLLCRWRAQEWWWYDPWHLKKLEDLMILKLTCINSCTVAQSCPVEQRHTMKNPSASGISDKAKNKWRGTSTCCFPWQSLCSMLEVTVTKVRLKAPDSWHLVWTLQSLHFLCLQHCYFTLYCPSYLIHWPNIHGAAVQFCLTCLHRYELGTQAACTTIHLQKKNWIFSLSVLLSGKKNDERLYDPKASLYVDR